MAFKEIHQTLLVQIDFLANSPNFSHAKLSFFTVCLLVGSNWMKLLALYKNITAKWIQLYLNCCYVCNLMLHNHIVYICT